MIKHWTTPHNVILKVTAYFQPKLHVTLVSRLPRSPIPLSSTPGLFTQRRACSILPSKVTAGLAGLMFATALLVLDCRVSSAAPICFANARASGLSPLPLRRQPTHNLKVYTKKDELAVNMKPGKMFKVKLPIRHHLKGKHHHERLMPKWCVLINVNICVRGFGGGYIHECTHLHPRIIIIILVVILVNLVVFRCLPTYDKTPIFP